MKIIKILPLAPLLAIQITAYSQFNTVKKIKILPQIQVDSIADKSKLQNIIVATDPIDSIRYEMTKQQPESTVSMPLSRLVINSNFGPRRDPLTGEVKFHEGIDFKGYSDSVMVIMPGEVKKVAYSRGLGNYIEVEHGEFKTTYGHLAFIMVREKTIVNAGQVIGITGSTGRSTGDHLHFAIKHKGRIINPTPFLDLIYKTLEISARRKQPI